MVLQILTNVIDFRMGIADAVAAPRIHHQWLPDQLLVEPGMPGRRLALEGFVVTRSCRPVFGALLDFWHADAIGEYDNKGFRLRGHQFADALGRYRLSTILPGLYPGRTRHVHVKVRMPSGRLLTTQLYFPGEPRK